MKYYFLHYILDTKKQELLVNDVRCELTHVQYQLLLYLVEHPQVMFSKEEILNSIWNGRQVTANSIDQIISKLRKQLDSTDKNAVIKTVYAKGIIFVPEVKIDKQTTQATQNIVKPLPKTPLSNRLSLFKISAIIALIILGVILGTFFKNKNSEINQEKSVLLFVPADQLGEKNNQDWLNLAAESLFNQLYTYDNSVELKKLRNKPSYLNTKQFITKLWQVTPALKLVKTQITQTGKLYNVSLSITDKQQNNTLQTFSHQNLSLAIQQASKWLSEQTSANLTNTNFIPKNSYLLELYMHGLSNYALNEFDKAEDYFKLCLKEKSDFNLARLQLARIKKDQGQLKKSLALLETLAKTQINAQMSIEIEAMKGDIYDTQGQYTKAEQIYLAAIDKYQQQYPSLINPIRFNLSHTYTLLNDYTKALEQLDLIEKNSHNQSLLSHVFQKKASILLNIGKVKQAKIAAEKSLALFEKQQDLLGKAKIYSTISRISTHQAKYKQSLEYLQKALSISQGIDYKLGSGAILNEMIYLLLVQGKYSQAWQANLDMEKIALDIGYDAMLQISKQYAMDISRAQKKWKQAEIYLQEHLRLAQASRNKKAIIRNKVLALDLHLDENKLDNVLILIQEIQDHIDQSKEYRLQPRLDKQKARYYLLTQQDEKALQLLLQAKTEAQSTQDGETLIEINNMLASYYLNNNQLQKAQAILEESQDYNPLPYPYLLLKSKVKEQQGSILTALDLANECKLSAYENWTQEDEIYLNNLIKDSKK